MLNNETQTKEVNTEINDVDLEQEMKELNSVEQTSNTAVPTDECNKKGINPIFSKKVIPYYDPSVLSTNSEASDTVDYYFDSVTCLDKGIENLLIEMIGYSLAETSKLNKAFALMRTWKKWKINHLQSY